MIFDLFNHVTLMKHALKSMDQALKARGIASPYTKQVVYSMICLIEENCQEMKRILEKDQPPTPHTEE